MKNGYLTTKEAAVLKGLSIVRIRQFCDAGRIAGATKFGRDWLIPLTGLQSLEIRKQGKPGHIKKT